MAQYLPVLLAGILMPLALLLGGMWLIRRWRDSTFSDSEDGAGSAMGSAAFEAMLKAAREQQERLARSEGDPGSGSQRRPGPPSAPGPAGDGERE